MPPSVHSPVIGIGTAPGGSIPGCMPCAGCSTACQPRSGITLCCGCSTQPDHDMSLDLQGEGLAGQGRSDDMARQHEC